MSLTVEDLNKRFTFHPATEDETKSNHEQVRLSCLKLALFINSTVPEGREKSLAITHLEEVMMWANAGIARNS